MADSTHIRRVWCWCKTYAYLQRWRADLARADLGGHTKLKEIINTSSLHKSFFFLFLFILSYVVYLFCLSQSLLGFGSKQKVLWFSGNWEQNWQNFMLVETYLPNVSRNSHSVHINTFVLFSFKCCFTELYILILYFHGLCLFFFSLVKCCHF